MYDTKVMEAADNACCRNADIVLTTSQDLQNRCKTKNSNSVLIGHGVNLQHFAAPLINTSAAGPTATDPQNQRKETELTAKPLNRPADLPPGKIIGFFGLLSEWVDRKLILKLAGDLGTRASIVLIGRADIDIADLESQPNIHILGPKAFSELPLYTAFFDAAIIPFIINELTIAVNPIKLREMLAAGCPVVSTNLPEVHAVARDNPYVTTAEDSRGFIDAVIKQLDNNLTLQDRKNISSTMQNETWSSKVDNILENIAQI
jgi:glycosyltransferase involved in cell wall biosynthesis